MIQIDMPMPEKCEDCIFCGEESCNCVASEYDGLGINVGCAFRTGRRDIRCPLKEREAQKFFVDESGKITPLPVVVRCKDCVHRGEAEKCVLAAISEEKDYPLFMLDNRGEWFCADGEAKE